jgi:hypothetical protein
LTACRARAGVRAHAPRAAPDHDGRQHGLSRLAISPVLLGRGEALLAGIDLRELG